MVSQFNKQFLHYVSSIRSSILLCSWSYVRTKKLKRTMMYVHDNDDTMNQQ